MKETIRTVFAVLSFIVQVTTAIFLVLHRH